VAQNPRGCDTDALNTLLRIEIAAVETYNRAVAAVADELVIADLQKIRDEHSRAVRELRDRVVWFAGQPAEGAKPWDEFASVVRGVQVVAPARALAALRVGEEHGIGEYEAALENTDIHADCHRLIRTDILPVCRRHVEDLNRLLGGTNT